MSEIVIGALDGWYGGSTQVPIALDILDAAVPECLAELTLDIITI